MGFEGEYLHDYPSDNPYSGKVYIVFITSYHCEV